MRNGVGIVSEIPSRYAQSIFNKVFEFGVGVALLERTPLGNYAIVIRNLGLKPRPKRTALHLPDFGLL